MTTVKEIKKIRVKLDVYHGGHNKFFFDIYDIEEIKRAAESELPFNTLPCVKWFGWRQLNKKDHDYVAVLVAIMEAAKAAYKDSYEEIVFCGLNFAGYWRWISGSWVPKTEHTKLYADFMRKISKHIRIRFEKGVKF